MNTLAFFRGARYSLDLSECLLLLIVISETCVHVFHASECHVMQRSVNHDPFSVLDPAHDCYPKNGLVVGKSYIMFKEMVKLGTAPDIATVVKVGKYE